MAGCAGWRRRPMRRRASPRCRRSPTTRRSAAIRAMRGGRCRWARTSATIDAVCRTVNAGRSVAVPTTVGFCMYIRRAALDQVGGFDAAAFGRGYGEENDFCMRAAQRGWSHRLACDTFVYHDGGVSFGAGKERAAGGSPGRARRPLSELCPPRRAACQSRCGRAVSVRGDGGAVSPHGPAGRADAVAPTGRRRAPAYRRTGRPARRPRQCPAAAGHDPRHDLVGSGAGQRPAADLAGGPAETTWWMCCAPPRCRACMCIT